jgi:hypothetical protein
MKNKIYSKLFKFSDVSSWQKENSDLVSNYYDEYKLEYHKSDFKWTYVVYKGVHNLKLHKNFVTLNIVGKVLLSLAIIFILAIIFLLLTVFINFNFNFNLNFILYFYLAIFLILNIPPLFNWTIYKKFLKVRYYIRNNEKIKEKEKEKNLYQEVNNTINKKIISDPKLARKNKIKKLNKKNWFYIICKQFLFY